jgi:hypothetical protein
VTTVVDAGFELGEGIAADDDEPGLVTTAAGGEPGVVTTVEGCVDGEPGVVTTVPGGTCN